jgi:hypothetical protein
MLARAHELHIYDGVGDLCDESLGEHCPEQQGEYGAEN